MTKIVDSLKLRKSVYDINKEKVLSNDEITNLIKEVTLVTPSAFNAQTQRVVILFDEKSDKLWDITTEELRKVAPAEGFENTVNKMNMFKSGQGTILYYFDQATVTNLENNFPLYADNFKVWAQQENGMVQLAVWSALAEHGYGASLQHYNPVIDEAVANEFKIDSNWKLVGQMPFGKIVTPGTDKDKLDIDTRVVVK